MTINYKNPDDLEKAIKERIKTLLNATVVDVMSPSGASEEELDDLLGVVDIDDEDEDEDLNVESDIAIW